MGGVGTTLISHAKELYDYGLAALVLTRQLKFNDAYQRLKLVQSVAGLAEEVLDGTKTFGEAFLAARSNSANEQTAKRETTPSRKALTDQVAELQRSVAKLTEETEDCGTPEIPLKSHELNGFIRTFRPRRSRQT